MNTIYFICFCLGIAYIIYWSFRNDDLADFQGEEKDKRFSPTKSVEDASDN